MDPLNDNIVQLMATSNDWIVSTLWKDTTNIVGMAQQVIIILILYYTVYYHWIYSLYMYIHVHVLEHIHVHVHVHIICKLVFTCVKPV